MAPCDHSLMAQARSSIHAAAESLIQASALLSDRIERCNGQGSVLVLRSDLAFAVRYLEQQSDRGDQEAAEVLGRIRK